jgi:hypothetical protein
LRFLFGIYYENKSATAADNSWENNPSSWSSSGYISWTKKTSDSRCRWNVAYKSTLPNLLPLFSLFCWLLYYYSVDHSKPFSISIKLYFSQYTV